MMKKIFCVIAFVFSLILFSDVNVDAKVSVSNVFEVTVGEEKLTINYVLVENRVIYDSNSNVVGNYADDIMSMVDGKTYTTNENKVFDEENNEVGSFNASIITLNEGTVYELGEKKVEERIQFNVSLKGIEEEKNYYRWEHNLCYKISGSEEVCEFDVTGEDSNNKIYGIYEYSYYFFDGHMPYYSDSLEFEYVTFKNKFICLDCESSKEVIVNDITFDSSEIDYKYNYDIVVDTAYNDGKKYVKNYYSSQNSLVYVPGSFKNNSASNLNLDSAPVYKIVNEVCVEGDCVSEEIDKVYASSDTKRENPLKITPFLGNLDFYYSGSNLVYDDGKIEQEFAKFRTTLVCIDNCLVRRVVNSLILIEEDYFFDYTKPFVDEENTIINSYDELIYVKNSEIKITVSDSQSGIDESKLKYYIVRPFSGYCSMGSEIEYSFINGESFFVGDGLNGGYCLYYVAYDKNGNNIKSDYYIYYFDNVGPVMEFNNRYESTKYYNNVTVSPVFTDSLSGVKVTYYLWSKEVIDDYLKIKEFGKIYDNNVSSNELNEDGSYYLYFLSYDNLDNYKVYDAGLFNIDTVGLSVDDIEIEKNNFNEEGYSNLGKIKLNISEMGDKEQFYCAFLNKGDVELSDLTDTCYNGKVISLKDGLEGSYGLYIYPHDRANNYSLLNVLENIKIDTKGPVIDSSILYDDDIYRLVNEITVNVSDLSGVNSNSLKYDWIIKDKSNVTSNELKNSFVNNGVIGYPSSYYGEYKLHISAMDNLGNETFVTLDKIFKIDSQVVRISLVGEETIVLFLKQEYEELGARAYKGDVAHGGRVSEIVVEGEVDVYKAGTYYITYSSGEGDLKVSVTRTVIVKSDVAYKRFALASFVGGFTIIALRLFVRRKNDEKYNDFSIK